VLLVTAGSAAAAGSVWRVERGALTVVVPLKPGGAFEATAPGLEGTLTLAGARPALLTGEISMDLSTLDTGIKLRNQHLRDKYLEVWRGKGFDRAVLSGIRLPDADGEAYEGPTAFSGVLLLHGTRHPVEGRADISRAGAERRVRAEFRLTLTDFGVEPPEYLGVGVANKLLVKVQLDVRKQEAAK
jgi:polyisoprenoid-binding protein YceI